MQNNQHPVFKKSDFFSALIIGEAVAWLVLAIIKNLEIKIPFLWLLPILFPVLAVAGLYICYLISRTLLIIYQVGKYVLVGFFNTFLDWGVLNFLIYLSGIATGSLYVVFKSISFVVALINSYFWNKLWTFKKNQIVPGKKTSAEFLQFFIVSLVGVLINVGIASLVVIGVGPKFGLTEKIWANVGAFFGTLISMVWNFIGYKFIVFKE